MLDGDPADGLTVEQPPAAPRSTRGLRHLRHLSDRSLTRELIPMVALSATEGGARALSFLFYVLAARELAPTDFGVVRYTITLATLAGALLGVLGNSTTRDLGAGRGDRARTRQTLGSAVLAAIALWAASLALAVGAAVAGLTGAASIIGLCATLTGYGVFTLYYAMARGLGQMGRAAGSYLGASAVQLGVFAALVVFTRPGATVALLVFGLSSALPILACELVTPVLRGQSLVPGREGFTRLWRIGGPLLLAQVFYLVWLSADQIWVEGRFGVREVGIYGAARNLVQVFLILPAGVTGVLMPRLAELRSAGAPDVARRLIRNAMIGLIGGTVLLGIPVALTAKRLLGAIYGPDFSAGGPALVALVAGMVFSAGLFGLTEAAVGWGRPGVYTLGIAVAALGEVAGLLAFGGDTSTSAAWWFTAATALGLATVMASLVLRPLTGRSSPRAAEAR